MTKMSETTVKALEEKGAKRWTKNGHDRLYIDAELLGLECDHYNSGNISSAKWCGEKVSNADARRIQASKVYIDVETGELSVTTNFDKYGVPSVEEMARGFAESVSEDEANGQHEAGLTPIHECNAREVEMMVGKAMCAYANWQNSLKAVYGAEDDADRTMYKQNAIACKSEYEATIRIIDMFVTDSIYGIQAHVVDRAEAELLTA